MVGYAPRWTHSRSSPGPGEDRHGLEYSGHQSSHVAISVGRKWPDGAVEVGGRLESARMPCPRCSHIDDFRTDLIGAGSPSCRRQHRIDTLKNQHARCAEIRPPARQGAPRPCSEQYGLLRIHAIQHSRSSEGSPHGSNLFRRPHIRRGYQGSPARLLSYSAR